MVSGAEEEEWADAEELEMGLLAVAFAVSTLRAWGERVVAVVDAEGSCSLGSSRPREVPWRIRREGR